jgi:hypothetical protein
MSKLQNLLTQSLLLTPLLISSCSSEYMSREKAEQEFYGWHPNTIHKIKNLSAYVESTPFREVIRYYRFNINQEDAEKFLAKENFVNINLLRVDRSSNFDKLTILAPIKCDFDFIELVGSDMSYRKWWDIKKSSEQTCYLIPPDSPRRQTRAVYDNKREILYLYSRVLG